MSHLQWELVNKLTACNGLTQQLRVDLMEKENNDEKRNKKRRYSEQIAKSMEMQREKREGKSISF